MFCKHCNEELDYGASVCPVCGAVTLRNEDSKVALDAFAYSLQRIFVIIGMTIMKYKSSRYMNNSIYIMFGVLFVIEFVLILLAGYGYVWSLMLIIISFIAIPILFILNFYVGLYQVLVFIFYTKYALECMFE